MTEALDIPLALDPASDLPLHRQLYDALRAAILDGRLASNTRLPATRAFAQVLGVSRNTVLGAFEQLTAEGYLEGRVGAGTYVASALPDDLLTVGPPVASPAIPADGLSRRGALLASNPVSVAIPHGGLSTPAAFRPGIPALDEFPFEIWSRLLARRWRRPPPDLLTYGPPAGYAPLREAVSSYLGASRGVRCVPEQVIIVSGSQQALDLAARLLLDPGDLVWFEEPGYLGARGALRGAGAQLVPVPVDAEGLLVTEGERAAPNARLAYVTPSHQYPLGVTMSLGRRLALLEWASRAGAWVLEDDYDSEYRYAGRPLAALQGLDRAGRVLYIGTFSKVLFPALRLGYLVVPPNLADAFVAARALSDRHPPGVEQAALADFIQEGHFGRHIRRMRTLYAERQAVLVEAAAHDLGGALSVLPAEAGMHLVGLMPNGGDDRAVASRAAAQAVDVTPLAAYHIGKPTTVGLMLGYAGVPVAEIRAGVRRLALAF